MPPWMTRTATAAPSSSSPAPSAPSSAPPSCDWTKATAPSSARPLDCTHIFGARKRSSPPVVGRAIAYAHGASCRVVMARRTVFSRGAAEVATFLVGATGRSPVPRTNRIDATDHRVTERRATCRSPLQEPRISAYSAAPHAKILRRHGNDVKCDWPVPPAVSSVLLRGGDGHRLFAIGSGEQLLQVGDLRQVVEHDIGVGGIVDEEVLVIGLGREESLQGIDPGRDGAAEDAGAVELGDIGLGDALLPGVGIEDGGTILRSLVRSLAIELGRIMRDGEEYAQDFAIGDLRRIEADLDRFGVAGFAAADLFVAGGRLLAAGIAGHHLPHALHMLEDALHAPEAAARQHRGLQVARGERLIDGRRRYEDGRFVGAGT